MNRGDSFRLKFNLSGKWWVILNDRSFLQKPSFLQQPLLYRSVQTPHLQTQTHSSQGPRPQTQKGRAIHINGGRTTQPEGRRHSQTTPQSRFSFRQLRAAANAENNQWKRCCGWTKPIRQNYQEVACHHHHGTCRSWKNYPHRLLEALGHCAGRSGWNYPEDWSLPHNLPQLKNHLYRHPWPRSF